MALQIRPIGQDFAAEASGIDLREPLSDVDAAAIHAGMNQYGVLVFHGEPLSTEQQLDFSIKLGPLEEAFGYNLRNAEDYRLPVSMNDVSNLDEDGLPFAADDRRRLFQIGNRLWHSDSSFKPIPAKYSILHSHATTSWGGNTEFADMRAAYDALDQKTKDLIEDLVCEHSQIYSRAKIGFNDLTPEEQERFKPVRQRLVRIHPTTGRKSVYLASHIGGIEGWSVPDAMLLLMDLTEIATQRQFVYSHEWTVGDVVIWDNRVTMHRGRAFPANERRDIRRTTLRGDVSTLVRPAEPILATPSPS